MKRFFISILVPILLLSVFTGSTYGAGPPLGRFLVRIEGPPGPVERAVEASGGRVLHVYKIIPDLVAIQIPETAVSGLKRNPRVTSIEPDATIHAVQEMLPWGVDRIDAELVHSTNKGSGIKVGIIDSGIDKDHPDLDDNIKGGVNFVPRGRRVNPNSWDDDNGHGTHVAGTVAAEDNEEGVIGVAPEASLHAIKVLDRKGSGYYSWIIAGLEWCVTNGIDVVNMSLGGEVNSINLEEACENAYSAGVLLVAAAGNENSSSILYPAKYSSVIAVSATDETDERALFSNYGDAIELAAPGVGILSTVPGGGYESEGWSGTSMAAPHVAGTAALVIASKITDGSAFAVRAQLQNTAKDLGDPDWDPLYGYGLVDAVAATGTAPQQPNDTPIISITNPADGSTFDSGSNILFEGTASDTEDGDLTSNLVWTSNKDGQIGTGGSFSKILSDGNHTITAEVTDSGGKTGSGSISISITSGAVEIVEITKAVYNSRKQELKVEATSSDAPDAVLTLTGDPEPSEGVEMIFDSKRGKYKVTVNGLSQKPDLITVTSNHGGEATTSDIGGKSAPANASLQNYPNPFNPETNIEYGIKETGFVSINIYNIMGQVVRTLVNETQGAGVYTVVWNGRDEQGRELSSGIYYCRLVAGEQSAILKMLLLK